MTRPQRRRPPWRRTRSRSPTNRAGEVEDQPTEEERRHTAAERRERAGADEHRHPVQRDVDGPLQVGGDVARAHAIGELVPTEGGRREQQALGDERDGHRCVRIEAVDLGLTFEGGEEHRRKNHAEHRVREDARDHGGAVRALAAEALLAHRQVHAHGCTTLVRYAPRLVGASVVHVEVVDGVATITLDSPANRNALGRALLSDLSAALDRATAPDVRVVVLTHTGPAFCAGADLKERSSSAADSGPPDSRPMVDAMRRLMDADAPTIASVKGPVRAGGIGLMASCDLVVVAASVDFAFTEVRIGVAPAIISVPILGRANASLLRAPFLTGERFDAQRARSIGSSPTSAATATTSTASSPSSAPACSLGAPSAVAETKRLMRTVPTLGRDDAFEQMRALSDSLFQGADAAEGMAAFLEKRRPAWHTEPLTEPLTERQGSDT